MKGKEMSARICDAAIALFAARGYKDVSVNEICQAVQITKPTFYKYVKTKEDILFQYYAFVPDDVDPGWDTPKNNDYWTCITNGINLCITHYFSLGTDLLAHFMMYEISHGSLAFQRDLSWNRRMINLISKAQSSRQIQSTMRPGGLLETMMSYTLGFCFNLCTDPEINLSEATEIWRKNLARICCVNPDAEMDLKEENV